MPDLPTHVIRFADLRQRSTTSFQVACDQTGRASVAAALELLDLRKLRFEGTLAPSGAQDWTLTATLGATVTQACVITLDPVTTRIDEKITRSYVAVFETPESSEVEMPEDDSIEPLPTTLDLVAVMVEALSLALPPFPRVPGTDLGALNVTEPGKAAMTDDDAKPFAALSQLRDQLADPGDPDTKPDD